jgi:hypothetical protein
MERVVHKFTDFQSAERADFEYYRSPTPAQRLAILLELISRELDGNDPDSERLAPVYRIVKLGES